MACVLMHCCCFAKGPAQFCMLLRTAALQVEATDAQQNTFEKQLSSASAKNASLQSQLQAAGDQLQTAGTQLQASKLNMRYLKVRQQLSHGCTTPDVGPALSYVQAYEVSCAPENGGPGH